MNNNKRFSIPLAVISLATGAAMMSAQALADSNLGGERLTRFGAEKAGNADGSIPAYTGGLKDTPANYVPGSGRYPNPFASEKPVVVVNAANMKEHEKFLTPTIKHLMEKFPEFYINVYPTHRTNRYPEWVLENTERNAKTAKLTGKVQGDGVEGAFGGIPFPVPNNGNEVMWNFLLHYRPAWTEWLNANYVVRSSGSVTNAGIFDGYVMNRYYDRQQSKLEDPYFFQYLSKGVGPASQVGYNLILTNSVNYSEANNLSWVYTPGQRRVRTAPEFSYDTPAANFGGTVLYDEINMFAGRQDRFDFKLIGKEEKYVPYNVYRSAEGEIPTKEEYLTPNYSNPKFQRFEKHRVWVVEATLKEGARHVVPKKRFYVDEDSWIILEVAGYDRAGQLYRAALNYPFFAYDKGTPVMNFLPIEVFDLNKGYYLSSNNVNERPEQYRFTFSEAIKDPSILDPNRMAARGIR